MRSTPPAAIPPRAPTLPLSPSDLGALGAGPHVVAGRVATVQDGVLRLADAFSDVSIALAPGERIDAASDHGAALARGDVEHGDLEHRDLARGDLAVLAIEREPDGSGYRLVRVVERFRPRTPTPPDGEHARLFDDGVGPNLVARDVLFGFVRRFFGERRFLEVDTPAVVPSPGLDLHLDAVEAGDRWLMTSPEYQMKRLLVGGVPRLFQIGHVFRKGELGARHNPEFSMLEWYRAFASVDDVMADTEALVSGALAALTGQLELAGPHGPIDLATPFERLPIDDAFVRHAGLAPGEALALAEHDEDHFFRLLVERVEPALARITRPIFLVDYPISQASLARAKPSDPRVCERFELYLAGIELCNGFGELTDPGEQRRRLERDQRARAAKRKPVYPIDERFLAALDEGMPPSAGNALGLDRLLALAAGEPDIARVMSFPASWL